MRQPSKFPLRLVLSFFIGVLSSCASTAPVPELVEAANPSPHTPATLSTAQLGECATDAGGAVAASGEADYDPDVTYTLAKRMHDNLERIAVFADRVRAYRTRDARDPIFCYFDLKDRQLRYLTYLRPDPDGRAPIQSVNDAVLIAYAKMAGKNVAKVRLFGAFAD